MRHYSLSSIPAEISAMERVGFIFSPQPIIVEGRTVSSVLVKVFQGFTERIAFDEIKYAHNGKVSFDISRMLQLVSEIEPSDALKRVYYGVDHINSLVQPFTIEVTVTDTSGREEQHEIEFDGLLGALDGAEGYDLGRKTLRLFVNFPQTINVWNSNRSAVLFAMFSRDFNVDYNAMGNMPNVPTNKNYYFRCGELNIMEWMKENNPSFYDLLMRGIRCSGESSIKYCIQYGQTTDVDTQPLTLIPDLRTEGTYLRWLNRKGEVGYWLFENSKLTTATSVDKSFSRFIPSNTEPDEGVLPNAAFRDFKETRTMTIGSGNVSAEEYEYLCGLAASPVVEMLIDNDPVAPVWQRVNVNTGSFARNIRRRTPSEQTFEITITLPERNTIKI